MKHFIYTAALCVLSCLFISQSTLYGQNYAESGDAANTIASAQNAMGGGSTLNTITGSLSNGDQDIYCLTVADPNIFLATTHPQNFPPDLFFSLFDANGNLICWCDDSPGNVFGSATGLNPTISTDPNDCFNTAPACTGMTAGQTVYLYVTHCCIFPQDALNNNMLNAGDGPYDHPQSTTGGSVGAYTVNLLGAADAFLPPVPTLSQWGLILLALVLLAGGVIAIFKSGPVTRPSTM